MLTTPISQNKDDIYELTAAAGVRFTTVNEESTDETESATVRCLSFLDTAHTLRVSGVIVF